ncbi:MAG: EAL domain-containing protein [Rhodocyclaceae bacterium]|nr:EAL domain-containing protein [Rhodocyclaceae bacterium]
MPIDDLLAYFADGGERPRHHLLFDDSGVFGRYRDLCLHSAFQALHAADTLRPAAHEALLRARDEHNRAISPAEAFARPGTPDEVVYFDRLCRTLHALNFVNLGGGDGTLYLNVSGRHLLSIGEGGHGRTFEALLAHCGLTPGQIVLEILESGVDDLKHLQSAIAAYRQRGYRVAIDDFGCQNSNFDRLWRLEPDIVKIDRSLIVQATDDARARKILPKLVDIIHDLGARAVCEGIETRLQHDLAVGAGADLVQGFHYSRPASSLQPDIAEHAAWRRPAAERSGHDLDGAALAA